MDILYSIDEGYIRQFYTSVYSLFTNSSREDFNIYVLQKGTLSQNEEIEQFITALGGQYIPVSIKDADFKDAPITDRYPESIYYRLLAQDYLPESIERIHYLDADTLIINDICQMEAIDVSDYLYAGCSMTTLVDIKAPFNRVRLQASDLKRYFNSGVLIMNLKRIRQEVSRADIFAYIESFAPLLILPDQDVLNALYPTEILEIPDDVYNFDSRNVRLYELLSDGVKDMDWVMAHTVIIHFCGKAVRNKPWHKRSQNNFTSLYKFYWQQAYRYLMSLTTETVTSKQIEEFIS